MAQNQIMHIMEEQTDKRTDYWIETEEQTDKQTDYRTAVHCTLYNIDVQRIS